MITITNHTRKALFHYRGKAIASSAAAGGGIGILEKHKRQASRGRGTFRCHCQPHQQAAIESVPLRNLGKWKQRGSESAFFHPSYSDIRRLTESSRTLPSLRDRDSEREGEIKRGYKNEAGGVQVEAER